LASVASLSAAVPIALYFLTLRLLSICLNRFKTVKANSAPFGSSFPVRSKFFPN